MFVVNATVIAVVMNLR